MTTPMTGLSPMPSPEEMWRFWPCREGILASRSSNGEQSPGFECFLPDSSLREEPFKEPPLSVLLSLDEMRDIQKVTPDLAVAATFFGPAEQDKNANEDFALTALLEGPDGEQWTFAAVADGVSTRTFWPARSSRLSCLVAFKAVRNAVREGLCSTEAQLALLRKRLVTNLQGALLADQRLLKTLDILPHKWAPGTYQQFSHRNDLWYNSTLLIACLGPKEGFLLWAGDGGIQVLKKASGADAGVEVLNPLQSTEDLTVSTFVSLDVESSHFCIGRITYPAPSGSVEVYLASDGVDRTLQRSSMDYRELTLSDPHQAHQLLRGLTEKPQREIDNYSIAWLRNPQARILPLPIPRREEAPRQAPPTWVEPRQKEKQEDAAEKTPPEEPKPATVTKPSVARLSRKQQIWVNHALSFVLGVLVGLFLMRAFTSSPKPAAADIAPPSPAPAATPAQGARTPRPKPSPTTPPQASPKPAAAVPAGTGTPSSTAAKPEAKTGGKGKAKAQDPPEATDPGPRNTKIPDSQDTRDPGTQETANPGKAEGETPAPPAPATPATAEGNATPPATPEGTAPPPVPTATVPATGKQDPKTGGQK